MVNNYEEDYGAEMQALKKAYDEAEQAWGEKRQAWAKANKDVLDQYDRERSGIMEKYKVPDDNLVRTGERKDILDQRLDQERKMEELARRRGKELEDLNKKYA